MHILITGGAGFIGSNLAALARSSSAAVTILDDFSTGYRDNVEALNVHLVEASILDRDALAEALLGVDSVIHLAALGSVPRSLADPPGTHAANATGTLMVLEEARAAGVDHVVVASSSSVYGMNPALPKSERDWIRPMSPYGVTKLATEQYALAYQQSFGMKTLAFRLFNVYGPGQRAGHPYAAVIPAFVDAVLNERTLMVNGDGSNSRDFTYVGTVCRTILAAVVRGVTHPEPVNLAFGSNTSLNQLINAIGAATDRTPRVRLCPPRPGDVKHSIADSAVLTSLFPEISPIALQQGLASTISWLEAKR